MLELAGRRGRVASFPADRAPAEQGVLTHVPPPCSRFLLAPKNFCRSGSVLNLLITVQWQESHTQAELALALAHWMVLSAADRSDAAAIAFLTERGLLTITEDVA